MDRDKMLDELWSREQIRQLAMRYCRACDRGDLDLLESVYFADARDEHGFNATGSAREFLDAVPSMRSQMLELQHNVTNHLIEIDGDYAEGEVNVLAYHRFNDAGGTVLLALGARYLDKYERRGGEWRIAHRKCTDDWSVRFPAPPQPENAFTSDALPRGCAGRTDPSYDFFRLLAAAPPSSPGS